MLVAVYAVEFTVETFGQHLSEGGLAAACLTHQ
jgi:hypothetical protein